MFARMSVIGYSLQPFIRSTSRLAGSSLMSRLVPVPRRRLVFLGFLHPLLDLSIIYHVSLLRSVSAPTCHSLFPSLVLFPRSFWFISLK